MAFGLKNLLLSNLPLNVDKDFDSRLRMTAEALLQKTGFDLVVCDFVQMARNAIGLNAPSVLFQHNVESEIFRRLADQASWPMSIYLRMQARRMEHFEARACKWFSRVVAVSRRDQELFESKYGLSNVRAIDTSVDLEYFSNRNPSSDSSRVIFQGSLDWPPNQQGVVRFANRIWPIVRQRVPSAEFIVVGRNPSREVLRLSEIEGTRMIGTVPDVRPHLHSASVSIVPLYSGGGTRLKIFESMASQIPVVSTSLGAEGLDVRPCEHLCIADSDSKFAEAVIQLLLNRSAARAMAERAKEYVAKRFGTEAVARQFEAICFEAIESKNAEVAR